MHNDSEADTYQLTIGGYAGGAHEGGAYAWLQIFEDYCDADLNHHETSINFIRKDIFDKEVSRLNALFAESCSDMRAEGPYEGLGQCPQIIIMTKAIKAAIAALSQPATFPADIVAAKKFLTDGIKEAFAE